ncbi:hypothetical protein ACN469_03140 [Corallococcus terminator]
MLRLPEARTVAPAAVRAEAALAAAVLAVERPVPVEELPDREAPSVPVAAA